MLIWSTVCFGLLVDIKFFACQN